MARNVGDVDCHEEIGLLAFKADQDHQKRGEIGAIGVRGAFSGVDGRQKGRGRGFASIHRQLLVSERIQRNGAENKEAASGQWIGLATVECYKAVQRQE